MNYDTKKIELPQLTADLLRDKNCLMDNLFAEIWKQAGMNERLRRVAFRKRSGTSANDLNMG